MYKVNYRIFYEIHRFKPENDPRKLRYYMFENFKRSNNPGYIRFNDPRQAGLSYDYLSTKSFLFQALKTYYQNDLNKFAKIPFYSYYTKRHMIIMYPTKFLSDIPYDYTWFYHDLHQHPAKRFIRWCRSDAKAY